MGKSNSALLNRGKYLEGTELSLALRQLRQIKLLADLSDLEIDVLNDGISIKSYRTGAIIVKYQEPADSVFVILSGRLVVRRQDSSGKELLLGIMGEGEIFGELAILTGGDRSADVLAHEPSIVAEIFAAQFSKLLAVSPRFSLRLMRALAERVQATSERLNEVSFLDLNQRLLQTLSRLATPVEIGGETMLLVRELPSHQELANLLGCSREAVTRGLKLLSAKGIIDVRDGQAEILYKKSQG